MTVPREETCCLCSLDKIPIWPAWYHNVCWITFLLGTAALYCYFWGFLVWTQFYWLNWAFFIFVKTSEVFITGAIFLQVYFCGSLVIKRFVHGHWHEKTKDSATTGSSPTANRDAPNRNKTKEHAQKKQKPPKSATEKQEQPKKSVVEAKEGPRKSWFAIWTKTPSDDVEKQATSAKDKGDKISVEVEKMELAPLPTVPAQTHDFWRKIALCGPGVDRPED